MYVSLHNRSAYSFGSALTRPQQLARFAQQQAMPAIALTDLNGLYGVLQFQHACRQVGVQPIIGAELCLDEATTLTLLVQSHNGYANLCRLISTRQLRPEPLTAREVCAHARDLICLLGSAPHQAAWSQTARSLRPAFEGRLYKELVWHGPQDLPAARSAARLADELDIPVAASCASRCLQPEQEFTLRALSSIGTLTLIDQPHPDKPEGQWHLRTPQDMQRLFQRRPDALRHTLEIAEACHFTLDLHRNRFPGFHSPDGRSAAAHLRALCQAGCRRRYRDQPPLRGLGGTRPTWDQVQQRLDRELNIIEQVHYSEYFLVFHEIVDYCRRHDIDTLARGSAADSLVCYALGVSHACPFRFDLPFDRFINAERAKFSKLADIDLDLPWDKREQVIRWVYDRWGHDRVAMIGCANTYKTRAAVAELGKAFGLPPHEIHQATKQMRHMRTRNLAQAIALTPEAKDVPVAEEPYRTIVGMAGQLTGLPRHWSMHPCGLVVSPEPLTDLVPVQRSPKGFLIAQYDMDAIEDLGFIKIDLLGQAGLSVLRDAVADIKRTDGVAVDLQRDVDYSDPATWEMIASGRARGVHHIESPAMTSLLQQCNCRDIDCLTSVVAIIRPGAANQGKKESFARRYQNLESYGFAHPSLEPILKNTYGLMVFEEHILQVATEFAGMDLGTADVLRRALNKQDLQMIQKMKNAFTVCARVREHPEPDIETVWSLLAGFAGFMFNKAHSAEYAVEAFQGAWLKRRWPAQYIAAILSNYRGFYAHSPTLPQILYVLEAHRLGVGFLPPCVNRSSDHFAVEYARHGRAKPLIRVPVSHIHGLSERLIECYRSARQRGPFTSPADFMERCRPGQAEAQALLDSGAFDGLEASRPALFWQIRKWSPEVQPGTATLWRTDDRSQAHAPPVTLTLPDRHDIAQREMELLGFPITIDPLSHLGRDDQGRTIDWSRYDAVNRLAPCSGRRVQVCGLMVADRIDATQQGQAMKFVSLGDRTGFVEIILFPDVYNRFGYLTAAHPILAVRGVVKPFENRNGFILQAQTVAPPARRSP